ncbi:hypothetical protein ACFL51_01935 [Myxococcota bacterium]
MKKLKNTGAWMAGLTVVMMATATAGCATRGGICPPCSSLPQSLATCEARLAEAKRTNAAARRTEARKTKLIVRMAKEKGRLNGRGQVYAVELGISRERLLDCRQRLQRAQLALRRKKRELAYIYRRRAFDAACKAAWQTKKSKAKKATTAPPIRRTINTAGGSN